ncbi:hypothetical protein [Xanthomonas citri]|uniref:hypothetical protein n=1 Tax=Xanthomonas citri TaxID=346 RepID=UPI0011841DA5|nr:hypothetical protein [Xanthomonas citri]QTK37293.1 hypothetical protein XcgCFBP7119R_12815 [Xanthomonas citri pv. glycines]
MEEVKTTSYPMEIGKPYNINNHHPIAVVVRLTCERGSTIRVVLPPTGTVTVVSRGDITKFEVDVVGGNPLGPRALD